MTEKDFLDATGVKSRTLKELFDPFISSIPACLPSGHFLSRDKPTKQQRASRSIGAGVKAPEKRKIEIKSIRSSNDHWQYRAVIINACFTKDQRQIYKSKDQTTSKDQCLSWSPKPKHEEIILKIVGEINWYVELIFGHFLKIRQCLRTMFSSRYQQLSHAIFRSPHPQQRTNS